MATRKEIETFTTELLRRKFPKAQQVSMEEKTNLVQAGILDSFAFLDLLSELEGHFGVQVDLGGFDFEVVSTLGGLCDAIAASG